VFYPRPREAFPVFFFSVLGAKTEQEVSGGGGGGA